MDQSPQSLGHAWQRELRRGLECLREGHYSRAETHFSRAHTLAPDCPDACYALGRERLRAGCLGDAELLLRRAWSLDTSLLSAACTLARCLGLQRGNYEAAFAVLDEARSHHPNDAAPRIVRSELLVEQGRLAEAEHEATAALEMVELRSSEADAARAVLARAVNHRGMELAARGDFEAALFAFRRASALDAAWAKPHANMGAAFVRLGRVQQARECYRRAIALEPDEAAVHFDLGVLLRQMDDSDARTELARAVDLDPSQAVWWTELGCALADLNQREEAEACWRQALALNPQHAPACRRLADLLVREARYLEAAVLAQRAADLTPEQQQ